MSFFLFCALWKKERNGKTTINRDLVSLWRRNKLPLPFANEHSVFGCLRKCPQQCLDLQICNSVETNSSFLILEWQERGRPCTGFSHSLTPSTGSFSGPDWLSDNSAPALGPRLWPPCWTWGCCWPGQSCGRSRCLPLRRSWAW